MVRNRSFLISVPQVRSSANSAANTAAFILRWKNFVSCVKHVSCCEPWNPLHFESSQSLLLWARRNKVHQEALKQASLVAYPKCLYNPLIPCSLLLSSCCTGRLLQFLEHWSSLLFFKIRNGHNLQPEGSSCKLCSAFLRDTFPRMSRALLKSFCQNSPL